jgi:integrase
MPLWDDRPPRFVQRFRDRHGIERLYFRRPGFARQALSGPLGSAAFWAAYSDAMKGAPVRKRPQTGSRTLGALIESWYLSPAFSGLKDSTKRAYRSVVEPLREKHGKRLVAEMHREHVMRLVAEKAATPGAGNNLLKRLRQLMDHAIKLGWRVDNPTSGVDAYRMEAGGFHTWEEQEVARYLEVHGPRTLARRAMLVMLCTGAARSDAVRLGWQNLRDGRLTYRRIKTARQRADVVVNIPILPALAEEIAHCSRDALTFLETAQRRSRSPAGLGNAMRKWCALAGLPECTPHGLRKACARRLAEAGCSAHEISAVTGHRTLSEVQRYADKADRAAMGAAAMERLVGTEREQKVSNHPGRFDKLSPNPLK